MSKSKTPTSIPKDEPGAQKRFDEAIKRALATPPTPHKPKTGKESKPTHIARSLARRRAPLKQPGNERAHYAEHSNRRGPHEC